jgi:aminodeoxyfutalosine deaminase
MIVRARAIVTMNGAPIRDGAVRIEGARIAEVGKVSQIADEQVVELHDCVLLPGLINAHCHLDYTSLRGRIPPPQSFTHWIRAINAEKAKLTTADYLEAIADGFREVQRFGTTTLVNFEAFPELIATAPASPVRTWWCAELIDVAAPQRTEEILAAALHSLRFQKHCGLAPHALFTASAELYCRCAEVAATNDWLLTTHLAESREEMEMFRDAAGPLFEFLLSRGRDNADCGRSTPLQRFLEVIRGPSLRGARNDKEGFRRRWLVAHLNELSEDDFQLLREQKFSIVHCPRSHAYFGHSPFPFERLRDVGCNICLGTDSLASNTDLSLFAEMRSFRQAHPQLSALEVLETVTVNPARAFGAGLGRIAPGCLADMIALPINGSADIHEQIIAFVGTVPWIMIEGQVL